MTETVMKIFGLEKEKMKSDGLYICSQSSKLMALSLETVYGRLDTEVKKSKA